MYSVITYRVPGRLVSAAYPTEHNISVCARKNETENKAFTASLTLYKQEMFKV